ncbi:hypothetical protein E2320_007987, partial [Naja naja]
MDELTKSPKIIQISLWSLLVTLVILFILTGTMLGPELLATIPATVYAIAVLMPLSGYCCGYGVATLFHLPPHCKRTVSLETGCQNVQLCTAILKLSFPPQLIGNMYMFPLLYALFQSAEAGLFVLVYKIYGKDLYKQEPLGGDSEEDTDVSYKKLKEEETPEISYGTVVAGEDHVPGAMAVTHGAARLVRFPRTIAVYSPVASGRLTTFLEEPEGQEPPKPDAGPPPPSTEGDAHAVRAKAEASGAEPQERKKEASVPDGAGGSPSKPQAASSAGKGEKFQGEGTPQALGEEAEPNKARVRFQ